MKDPTSDLEAWAATYRELRRPSPARRRAIQAGVLAGAAAQDRRVRTQRWVGIAVLVAAGVLGALALGRLLDGQGTRVGVEDDCSLAPHSAREGKGYEAREGETVQRGGADGSAVSVGGPESTAGIPNAEPGSSAPATAGGEAGSPPSSKPTSRSTSDHRRPAEPEPTAEPSTSDELESMRLLRDAERRLESDALASLRLLERHEARFPASTMALEREALTVIALCRLGRLDAGRERQQAFLQRHGSSAYASRVRSACEAAPSP